MYAVQDVAGPDAPGRWVVDLLDAHIARDEVRINATINWEVWRHLDEKVNEALKEKGAGPQEIRRAAGLAARRYRKIKRRKFLPQPRDHFYDMVREMYAQIWEDRSTHGAALDRWARTKVHNAGIRGKRRGAWDGQSREYKDRCIGAGPPEGNDLVILASAARLRSLNGRTALVTLDGDFCLFADVIRDDFDVEVICDDPAHGARARPVRAA